MADQPTFEQYHKDFQQQTSEGTEIGALLWQGSVGEAHERYDDAMARIDGDTQDPVDHNLRKRWIEDNMQQQDPVDVLGPGNGMDEGHFIYWNAPEVVNQVQSRIDEWCKTRNSCLDVPRGAEGTDTDEIGQFLHGINEYLRTALPDGLERHAFVEDFNRRRHSKDFEAILSPSLLVQIKSVDYDRGTGTPQ